MIKYYADYKEVAEGDFYFERNLGVWWNDRDILVMDFNGIPVALDGWDGEKYTKCFKVIPTPYDTYLVWNEAGEDLPYSVAPVYADTGEDVLRLVGYYYPYSL